MKRNGIPFGDIVILSPMRYERSIAGVLEKYPVSTDRLSRQERILFATVQSFKGLESPVVIITDFDSVERDSQKNLLYVGMTRARSALYILVSDKARKTMNEMIQGVRNNAERE